MMGPLVLADRLDLPAVRPLAAAMLARAGGDLVIDASGVRQLGGLALQLLLAAAQRWRADGLRLSIAPRSAAFSDALHVFGLDADMLEVRPCT